MPAIANAAGPETAPAVDGEVGHLRDHRVVAARRRAEHVDRRLARGRAARSAEVMHERAGAVGHEAAVELVQRRRVQRRREHVVDRDRVAVAGASGSSPPTGGCRPRSGRAARTSCRTAPCAGSAASAYARHRHAQPVRHLPLGIGVRARAGRGRRRARAVPAIARAASTRRRRPRPRTGRPRSRRRRARRAPRSSSRRRTCRRRSAGAGRGTRRCPVAMPPSSRRRRRRRA